MDTLRKPVHGGESYLYPEAIDFSSNINPLGPSKKVIEAIKNNIENIAHYPSKGEKLKKTIAEKFDLRQENIALGNGSSELIKNFCEAFLGKGDRVLISSPTFSEYEYFSRLRGAEVYHFNLPEEQELEAEILNRKGFKAVFLCHPNNPTSHIFKNLEALLEKSRALIFVDEAYIEFSEADSFLGLVKNYDNLFILRSLTKFYSMAGIRIGYAVSGRENIENIEKHQPPWNINTLALEAARAALKDDSFIKESKEFFKREREFLFRKLSDVDNIEVFQSYANFFLIKVNLPAAEAKEKLLRKGILVRDCSSFGLENHIRICIRKRKENLRLLEALEELNAPAGKEEP